MMTPSRQAAGMLLAALDDQSGRRWLKATVAGLLLLALPLAAGLARHREVVKAWHHYAGDSFTREHGLPYRLAATALAERVSHLQGESPHERPRYRWTSQGAGDAAGYVETSRGHLPLAMQAYPRPDGGTSGLGLIENRTGAIVMAMAGTLPAYCASVGNWVSPYARQRGSVALVPASASVDGSAVDAATWTTFAEGMAACAARGDEPLTVLLRFDRGLSG